MTRSAREPVGLIPWWWPSLAMILTMVTWFLGQALIKSLAGPPLTWWLMSAWGIVNVAVMYWVMMIPARRTRERIRRHNLLVCTYCKYPLTGLPAQGCCPECGQKYTFDDARRHWSIVVPQRK